MKQHNKDLILSHLPLCLVIINAVVLVILDSFKKELSKFVAVCIPLLVIVQGLVYIFKRNVYLKGDYLNKYEKIIYGLVYIVVAIYSVLKGLHVI